MHLKSLDSIVRLCRRLCREMTREYVASAPCSSNADVYAYRDNLIV